MQFKWFGLLTCTLLAMTFLNGCQEPSSGSMASNNPTGPTTVFLSVVSDVTQDPQAIDMAMKFAGFALEEQRNVVLFFNVKGVEIPVKSLAADLAFAEGDPIKQQLEGLIKQGVEVHVCPICMKALGVEAGDLIDGAEVTTRAGLFSHIGSHTTVFTY